jgi:hypothetical protein
MGAAARIRLEWVRLISHPAAGAADTALAHWSHAGDGRKAATDHVSLDRTATETATETATDIFDRAQLIDSTVRLENALPAVNR